jgi:hypothetical protein
MAFIGRPSFLPFARAFRIPALTRSRRTIEKHGYHFETLSAPFSCEELHGVVFDVNS